MACCSLVRPCTLPCGLVKLDQLLVSLKVLLREFELVSCLASLSFFAFFRGSGARRWRTCHCLVINCSMLRTTLIDGSVNLSCRLGLFDGPCCGSQVRLLLTRRLLLFDGVSFWSRSSGGGWFSRFLSYYDIDRDLTFWLFQCCWDWLLSRWSHNNSLSLSLWCLK